jgi:serine/threonine-protein kinase
VTIDDELPPLFDGDPGLPTVLRAGYQIGNRYTLGRPLGRGGFGSLWIARDEDTKERVAVKVLQAVPNDDDFQEAATRLRREARAYQKLSHPAVTKLRNLGTTDQGEPYIVMELLKGTDLAGKLGLDGDMAPSAAVQLMLPIADALAEAHDNDLVHRDVKLGNIFLAEQADGTIATKLIDFGLTKQLDTIASQSLTGAGVRIGSPSYMSPEQARGRDVDPRSDVWSFCVVLYRMVTGRLPFVGETHLQQRKAIIEKMAPTFEALGVEEPQLWSIVERGLEKPPDDRWQSMRLLASALREWLAAR